MKRLLFIVALLAIFFNSNAQKSRLGFKAGLNISNFDEQNAITADMIGGYHGGLFCKLALSKHFSIQPELLYSVKGSDVTYDNLLYSGSTRINLTYFDVPLLLVFNPIEKINVHGGIYFSSLSKTKVENIIVQTSGSSNFEQILSSSNFHSIDYGLIIGGAVELGKLTVGARYNYGLRPVGKKYDFGSTIKTFPDGKNAVIQVYVGISII